MIRQFVLRTAVSSKPNKLLKLSYLTNTLAGEAAIMDQHDSELGHGGLLEDVPERPYPRSKL